MLWISFLTCLLSFRKSAFVISAPDNELVLPVKELEARQGPAVASASSFLRRSFTACELDSGIASLAGTNQRSQRLLQAHTSI